jgi:hypothetical protein
MQKKLYILVTLLLLQCSPYGGWGAFAQTYPVTISTQLTQPSPIYLSNYANTTSINSPIKVQLILNDLTIMNRQVRLKCYFQGAVSFVSNDFVVGAAPIYLEGGFPTLLTNVELGPYFEFQNLQGVNPNQYAQPLPEGIYTISFDVFDFATNKKLSKKSSVTTIIFQNEPPFLNLPVNKAEIVEQNIQNIIFSWTPRSINVSNVEYEFSLVEIWNTNTPLQNVFAYSQPLYTTTTRNTTVQYSIAEPQLIPGKTYAWRIKAKALVGAEEIGVFKNNGYSEIFSFKYLTFCKAPLAIITTDVSQEQAKVTWSGEVDNYDYQVNYREKNADSKWYKLVTPREYITISNLKPKTTYEYTVGAACDPGEYTHSNIQEFTTLAQDEIAFVGCGIKPDPAALSNKTPLPALFPNDVVTAGDFPIVVLKSTGSNGTFSGEGYVTLPFLEKFKELIDAADALGGDKVNIGKYSRIRITFNNIGINTDFKLISGEIVASYDPDWKGMGDLDPVLNPVIDAIGNLFNELFVKADKIEEQKSLGLISDQEYKKELEAVWNDIKKADEQYKELIKTIDLPQDLKDKVENLKSPLPAQASNDNTAVKNDFSTQSKEYREKITAISEEVNAYKKVNCKDLDDSKIALQDLEEYKIYVTPVGDAIILRNAINLDLESIYPNDSYPDLKVPKGTLVAFTLGQDSYNANYKKENGKWRFTGYFNKNGKEYFDTDTDNLKSYFANKIEKEGIQTASCTIVVGALAEEALFSRVLLSLGIGEGVITTSAFSRVAGGTVVLGIILIKLFGSGTSVTYHSGEVLDLPETTPIVTQNIDDDSYVKNPPTSVPISIPHSLPKDDTGGKGCQVYCIYKVDKLTKELTVAKYGMTCQNNFKSDGKQDCNPRPEYQTNYFNKTEPNFNFHYTWVTPVEVSKSIAYIIEKSMIALYIQNNEGRLPTHHKRPCFVVGDSFDDELRRTEKAIEWIKEQVFKYGK